ncbi:Zn-dependent exopeptidase [Dendrothele bispora CBS 962.96]|uniref:Peptide hydrolase n=1 Tax=Dendrothele bispora (strain CBS 962.96) TaxID=1314807 RepID=A0A4S8MXZ9_DENBC|nr:Zn-dependent exopeptidase [Dendrothele bispora CBS 962.96]
MAKSAIPLLLLVTPFDTSLFQESDCISRNYYGNVLDGNTLNSVFTLAPSASVVPVSQNYQQLVWVQEKAVDSSLKPPSFRDEFQLFLERLSSAHSDASQGFAQQVLESSGYELLYRTETAALLHMSHEMTYQLDTLLPRYWKPTVLPTSPVPFIPVPDSAVEPVRKALADLKFDSTVDSLVKNISVLQMRNDARFLTGEDEKSGIASRHSFSSGARVAAQWLKERFEDTGASCKLKTFLQGFAPNVVCRYDSVVDTTGTVIISAHYDSRGSFGSTRRVETQRTDNLIGTTSLLNIARAIGRTGVKFHQNVELVAFAGEEQGLFGSRYYSSDLRAADANITLMIQADMLAYRKEGENPQLGLPDRIGTPEVAQLVANISTLYSPELDVGFTSACCSDHQSFHQQGYAATQVFERAGPIVDPMYHNSGDLTDRPGYDFEQLKSISKVQFATLLHFAGFEL